MKIITSWDNPEIKNLSKLNESKTRKEQGKFLAEGLRTCSALISSGLTPIQAYATEEMKNFVCGLVKEQFITLVSEAIMKKISSASTPSGLVCVFRIPQQPDPSKIGPGMVLANISDPGNMGTLIRSCAAMGVKSLVIVEGTDPWSPKVVQAAAGTLGQLNIFQLTWEQLLQNKKDLKLCALVVSYGKNPKDVNFKDCLLVIGNEAHGIPDQWLAKCDEKITLPMVSGVESLNAGVAGSIALYLAFLKT